MPRSNSQFVEVQSVPVLDEHVIKDNDGKILARIDSSKLEHIARVNNKRIKDTGDMIPIVIGHTKGEVGEYVPEQEQPEIVGYASNLSVGRFKNTTRKAIHATFKFFRDKLDKVRNFPRRSVELWLSDWKIDPISILGATTPERDLGLLQLSKGGKKVYRRILKSRIKLEKGESVDTERIVQEVLKAFEESDLGQFLQRLKDEVEGGGEDEGGPEGGPEGLPPEGEPGIQGEGGEEPLGEGEPEGEPERYSSVASGGNTYTQSFGGGKVTKKNYSRRQASPAGDRSLRVQLSRSQQAVQGLQTAYNQLRVRLQRSEREKDLLTLQGAGYDFDINEELDWLQGLPDDEYDFHFDRLRKRYSRAPVGQTVDLEYSRANAPLGGSQGRSKEQAMQIAEMAARKGITYEEALSELQ